jgi:hypothetical protein
MSAQTLPRDRRSLTWRKAKSTLFGSLTFSTILISFALLVALIVYILINARPLMAMRAASRAGLVVSTMVIQWDAKNLPYVIVTDFVPESEAARAGIGEFDAIIHIGSETVYRSAQVWEAIAHLPKRLCPSAGSPAIPQKSSAIFCPRWTLRRTRCALL